MKKLLFIFFIIFACSEGIAQKKETTRIKNVNPIFPLGIRFPVNPKTGKPIVCNSWDENQVFSDPEYSSIGDLTCFIYFADSTMKNILDKIVSKLGKNSNSSKKLLLDQKNWENKTKIKAIKAGDDYKGGTMEISEIYRVTYVEINSRIKYFRLISKKIKS